MVAAVVWDIVVRGLSCVSPLPWEVMGLGYTRLKIMVITLNSAACCFQGPFSTSPSAATLAPRYSSVVESGNSEVLHIFLTFHLPDVLSSWPSIFLTFHLPDVPSPWRSIFLTFHLPMAARYWLFCRNSLVDSLAPGKFEWNFRHVIFKQILLNDGWGISCEIALIWISLDFADDQSTLVQVMAWCHQATSHYLSQCWPRSLSPYGVTRPQWVNCGW